MGISTATKNRLSLALVGLIVGIIAGFVLNFLWYLFHALVLDWRDSAPDWYFPIQGTVRTLIFAGSLVVCLVGSQVVYARAKKRGKSMNMYGV